MTAGEGTASAALPGHDLVVAAERRALLAHRQELQLALATALRDGRDRVHLLHADLDRARRELRVTREAERAVRLRAAAGGGVVLTPGDEGETWVLEVVSSVSGPVGLAALEELPAGWQVVPTEHAPGGVALVGLAGSPGLQLAAGSGAVLLRLLRHPWSGSPTLRAADCQETIELRQEVASVVDVLCSAATIEVVL